MALAAALLELRALLRPPRGRVAGASYAHAYAYPKVELSVFLILIVVSGSQ